MHYTIGRKHNRATIGLPGSGIFVTEVQPRRPPVPGRAESLWVVLVIVAALVMLALAL